MVILGQPPQRRGRWPFFVFVSLAIVSVVVLLVSLPRDKSVKWHGITKYVSSVRTGGASLLRGYHNRPEHDKLWRFNVTRDSRNLGLSDEQCDAAFPKLFAEADRAKSFYASRRITPEHLDTSIAHDGDPAHPHSRARVMIHDGQLIILDYHQGECNPSRTLATLASIYRSIVALPDPRVIPNVEFVIDVEDKAGVDIAPANRTAWTYSRLKHDNYTWVMPDFDGWSYPDDAVGSYNAFRDKAAAVEDRPWEQKIPKAVWRGSSFVGSDVRLDLLDASWGFPWSDIKELDWKTRENLMDMHDFCKYQYVVHTEGNSWSGRLRYLHNCNSISIVHDLEWVAHYYPLLEPSGDNQNYIPVSRDFSDLPDQMDRYLSNATLAARVARNSVAAFRDSNLTPAAEACYWRRMFRAWRDVQAFEPALLEDAWDEGEGRRVRRRRGQSFERFAFREPGRNNPHEG